MSRSVFNEARQRLHPNQDDPSVASATRSLSIIALSTFLTARTHRPKNALFTSLRNRCQRWHLHRNHFRERTLWDFDQLRERLLHGGSFFRLATFAYNMQAKGAAASPHPFNNVWDIPFWLMIVCWYVMPVRRPNANVPQTPVRNMRSLSHEDAGKSIAASGALWRKV